VTLENKFPNLYFGFNAIIILYFYNDFGIFLPLKKSSFLLDITHYSLLECFIVFKDEGHGDQKIGYCDLLVIYFPLFNTCVSYDHLVPTPFSLSWMILASRVSSIGLEIYVSFHACYWS
jgi:hypothetical protein